MNGEKNATLFTMTVLTKSPPFLIFYFSSWDFSFSLKKGKKILFLLLVEIKKLDKIEIMTTKMNG